MNDTWRIILLAGAFLSFLVGAGTATGQEILQFFVSFGYYGIFALIIAAILHSWFGAYVMHVGFNLKAVYADDVFKYYCGKYIGTFLTWFAQMFILVVFIVMISGAGATFTEYYGMNPTLGKVIMALSVLATALLGLERLIKILGIAGPIIIVLSLVVGGISFITNLDGFSQAGSVLESIEVVSATSSWLQSGFVYSSYVLLVAVPFLARLGQNEQKRKNVVFGGGLGGILLLIVVGVIYLGILANIEIVYSKGVPTLYLADQINPVVGFIFSIVLLIAIYTTAVGLLWIVSDFLARGRNKYYKIIATALTILGFFGGLFPFGQIINSIYPFVGYLGFILLIGMFYRQFINKGDIESVSSDPNDKAM